MKGIIPQGKPCTRYRRLSPAILMAAILIIAILIAGFFSCSTLGLPSGQQWSPGSGKQIGTVELGTIRVDKNADWDSVEAEAGRLLSLLLAEAGYKQNNPGTAPEYRVDAVLIEREYMENWKTRRSLSAEVLIWKANGTAVPGAGEKKPAPVAAGKALLAGNKTLSSSGVLYDL
jgi:hypothetical protein